VTIFEQLNYLGMYLASTQVNSAFYPFEVGKSSTSMHGWN